MKQPKARRKLDLVADLQQADPSFAPQTVFDVGANRGLTTAAYLSAFPAAKVYAFEPAPSTFQALQSALGQNGRAVLHQLALNNADGEVKFMNVTGSTGNRIVRRGVDSDDQTETVRAMTGDDFCAGNGIGSIDLLKIDTEGHDLRVLVGFSQMLRARKITYIQVECTTSPDNHFHVQLDRFMHFLNPLGYRVFGLYEFIRRIYKTKQKLNGIWFCNAVFVREVDDPRLRTEMIN